MPILFRCTKGFESIKTYEIIWVKEIKINFLIHIIIIIREIIQLPLMHVLNAILQITFFPIHMNVQRKI